MRKVKTKGKVKKGSQAQWTKDNDVTFISNKERKLSNDSVAVPPATARGRSKSLRFGDFAHLDRVRKVDENELIPVDIAFFQEGKVSGQRSILV
jgi:hypothetical protein